MTDIRAEAQAEAERRYPKQPPNPPQPLNTHTIMQAVFIEGWMAGAEWRDAQVEALLMDTADWVNEQMGHGLYADRIADRLRALAGRTLQDEGGDGG